VDNDAVVIEESEMKISKSDERVIAVPLALDPDNFLLVKLYPFLNAQLSMCLLSGSKTVDCSVGLNESGSEYLSTVDFT